MHAPDMKPLSVRSMLYWMGVLSALLWNKVPTNYDEKKDASHYMAEEKGIPATGTYFFNYDTGSPHNLEGINLHNLHSKY